MNTIKIIFFKKNGRYLSEQLLEIPNEYCKDDKIIIYMETKNILNIKNASYTILPIKHNKINPRFIEK